ncbi:unnamed protein product [Cuscuta campestris]|uniref:IREH1/IRE-like N-terminal domain-containing protein n=1 Tax=Cuscuta campestris TaxID=132261 RepID=A0A484M3I9_9ASTE|nr:unnamed protein product [Cuscuta campestris]
MVSLDSTNYSIWKIRIEDYLCSKDLLDPISYKERPTSVDEKAWASLNRKAVASIKQYVFLSVLQHVANETNVFEMWKKLESMYERNNATGKAYLIRKLVKLQYKDGDSIIVHMNEFQGVVNQLVRMKMKLEDELQALLLLSSLPDSWDTLVVLLSNSAPDGKMTMEMVKASLLNEEARRKESGYVNFDEHKLTVRKIHRILSVGAMSAGTVIYPSFHKLYNPENKLVYKGRCFYAPEEFEDAECASSYITGQSEYPYETHLVAIVGCAVCWGTPFLECYNSYGFDWGINGRAWIPKKYFFYFCMPDCDGELVSKLKKLGISNIVREERRHDCADTPDSVGTYYTKLTLPSCQEVDKQVFSTDGASCAPIYVDMMWDTFLSSRSIVIDSKSQQVSTRTRSAPSPLTISKSIRTPFDHGDGNGGRRVANSLSRFSTNADQPAEHFREGGKKVHWTQTKSLKVRSPRHSNLEGHHSAFYKEMQSPRFQAILRVTSGRRKRVPDIKSFSHELDSKGVRPLPFWKSRAFGRMEEIMVMIRSKFDKLKEEVNSDLGVFAGDLVGMLEKASEPNAHWRESLEDLLVLARQCAEMSPSDFWLSCEGIVQNLDDRRQELPMGTIKQDHTRLLFILARCTRLVQFQKESGFEEHILSFHKLSDVGVYPEQMLGPSKEFNGRRHKKSQGMDHSSLTAREDQTDENFCGETTEVSTAKC